VLHLKVLITNEREHMIIWYDSDNCTSTGAL